MPRPGRRDLDPGERSRHETRRRLDLAFLLLDRSKEHAVLLPGKELRLGGRDGELQGSGAAFGSRRRFGVVEDRDRVEGDVEDDEGPLDDGVEGIG